MRLAELVHLFFNALWLLVLVYVLGSWLPGLQRQGWFRTVRQIVEPLLRPFRQIIPPEKTGGLDLSPIFLMIVLGLVQRFLVGVLLRLGL